jgi:hypothetical protein
MDKNFKISLEIHQLEKMIATRSSASSTLPNYVSVEAMKEKIKELRS